MNESVLHAPRRRVYCETMPLADLVTHDVMRLLARYGLEPIIAVRPWDLDALPHVVRACNDAGVPFSIWPMLKDEDGRWASVWNAEKFAPFAMETLARVQACRGQGASLLEEIYVDLEPPIEQVRAMLRDTRGALGVLRNASSKGSNVAARMDAGRGRLFDLARAIDERGARPSACCVPLVLLDAPDGPATWQALLGTPVAFPGWRHVNVMLYSSMIQGWSRGLFRRDDARAVLASFTELAISRFGTRAAVSLGAVGTGALESEPVYLSPRELADDVAIARAAGATDLALFDLGGVLRRPPAEAWLEAFAFTPKATEIPRMTKRVQSTKTIASLGAAVWRAFRTTR